MTLKELLKALNAAAQKGIATSEEKAAFKTSFEALDAEEKELVSDKLNTVLKLQEEANEKAELEAIVKEVFAQGGDKLEKTILEKVEKFVEEQMEAKAKKVGLYASDADGEKVLSRKAKSDRMREVMKSVLEGGFTPLYKEMTTDDTASPYAGFVTDSELSAEIRHLITEYGVAAREMMTVTVSQKSYKANDLVTDVSVYWVNEGAAIKSSEVVLGQQTLELKKLATIVTLTRELLQEEEIDLISFIAGRVAEGFAQAEDEAFFIGDGTATYGSFTGLLNNTNTNLVTMVGTTFASMDADDLLDMQDATPQGALANGKYYMHRSIRSIVRKLKDVDGQYIYQMPADNGPATIWGKPVVEVEVMPSSANSAADTAFVLFGDLKKATIRGIRGGIQADRFNAGTVRNVADSADINLITTDREAVRWVKQVGYIAIIPTAVTRLKTAAASA
jgi:HK97 family phage major capsid protein